MNIPNQFQSFLGWIQAFDHNLLQNEDDVETKFILPLFKYLGYPEKCRRGKYPLKIHNTGTQGRKPEIDQVYFASEEKEKQNSDTSLIIVEAKEPKETDLSKGITQAEFYSSFLEPMFLFVTNGDKINIFKRLRYRGKELVFDINLEYLKNSSGALAFHEKLNFEVVKTLNENIANELTHAKYVLLEKSLQRHPDLQEILEQGDFEASTVREGERLTVVRPKVAIECNLPKVFEVGNCNIEFSSVILKGLKIHLTHQEILGQIMQGLNTKPHWGSRRFLRQLDNAFEAQLGQTTVILSEVEATDLCLCVDEVCNIYKNHIIEAEDILETWDFDFVEFGGIKGFHLFSVSAELWKLMHKFSHEFDYSYGNSDWHNFKRGGASIQVSSSETRHYAFIWPQASLESDTFLPNGTIDIVYQVNNSYLTLLERWKVVNSWKQDVGVGGTWTASYTKKWLLKNFIPKVIDYYSHKNERLKLNWNLDIDDYNKQIVPIKDIHELEQLVTYLDQIQFWLNIYCRNIDASLLRSYYKNFTELVRNTEYSIIEIDYIREKLRIVDRIPGKQKVNISSVESNDWNFQHLLDCLNEQVERINNCEYESHQNAYLISRLFIGIIKHGQIKFSQAQLNAAKQALIPLWEQSRFEQRYIYANR